MKKYKSIKKASVLGILGNLVLFIIKIIIGFISGAQSMIADAFNSGGDVISSLMTFIGNKISNKPCDDDHNLGHGKAEYIYSLLISVIMLISSVVVLKKSIETLIYKKTYLFSKYLVIVCIITIIVKLLLFIYTRYLSKKYNSLLLKANSLDHRNDVIITIINLISVSFAREGIFVFDGIVGIIISIWIIYSSVKIFLDSYNVLMDKSIDETTKNEVLNIISKYEEIKKVQHFNSTPIGYKYQISFTIYVDGKLSTFESHEIANKLEKEIDNKIDEIYLTVIHVNPI